MVDRRRNDPPHLVRPLPWRFAQQLVCRLYYHVGQWHTGVVSEGLNWDADSEAYIRGRSSRYRDGLDIEPVWTQEVLDDADMVAFEPDPKSRVGAARFVGRSTSAGRVLVVIAYRDPDGDLHGVNAWPATGADLKFYTEGLDDGQDD